MVRLKKQHISSTIKHERSRDTYTLQGGAGCTSMHQSLYYNTNMKLPEEGCSHLKVAIDVRMDCWQT